MDEEPRLPLRQKQALETRRSIAEAARSLFLSNGYGATSIEAIAARAGVAASTIYAVFRTKRAILREIRAPWHEASRIREVAYASPLLDMDPAERLRRLAHATRRQWETGSEVVTIYRSAAAIDTEAAAELDAALRGRRAALEAFAEGLRSSLRPGLSVERAAALLRSLCLAEVYEELVGSSGWSPDEYEEWLAGALARELLPEQG